MTYLPHAVWLNVALFLSPLLLRDLYTVNHSFYEIAMDCRYRQLIFAYLDDRMIKNIVRLRDPEIAKRVRILHIDPSFLPLTGSAHLTFSHGKPESITKHRSLRSILGDIANLLLEQRKDLYRHPKYRIMQSLKRRDDVVQLLSEVLAGLPNVSDYYVSWYGPTPGPPVPTPFLTSPFQHNLRKLSLNLSLQNVPPLLTAEAPIPQLEELHLSIHPEHVVNELESTRILQDHLAPAISRLQATLKTLVISSWEPTDLSPLFQNIKPFATLEDLSINIPVEPCHLGHPSGLHGFLLQHQWTLRRLHLRPTQYGGKCSTPDLTSLHQWISDVTASVKFTNLSVLDMTSSLFPVNTSLMCLQRFSHTLSSLSLTGVYRSYDDVSEALHLATYHQQQLPPGHHGLGHLRIGPVSLCPELVDLIAEKLPSLHRLELLVKDIFPSIADSIPGPFSPQVPKRQQIEAFFNEMDYRRYPSWNLQHLAILGESLPEKAHYPTSLEQVFFHSIPSLRFFT